MTGPTPMRHRLHVKICSTCSSQHQESRLGHFFRGQTRLPDQKSEYSQWLLRISEEKKN